MTLTDLQAAVCVLLLGLSLATLPQAYSRALDAFPPGRARRLLGAVTLLAATLRALAPKWLVTVFIGYLLTEQAIELQADSHYGLGSQALYHALFSLLPHDHRVVQWANVVVGAATLPLYAGLAARLLRSPRAGLAAALLVAITPLFVKNDASEANLVPGLWWLFGGMVLFEEYLSEGHRSALLSSVPLIAFAAVSRPEMPVLTGAGLAAVIVARWGDAKARPWRDPWAWGALAVVVILAVPHVVHVSRAARRLADVGGLDTWHPAGIVPGLWRSLTRMNTLATPSLFPAGVAALSVVGAIVAGPWRARAALLALSAFAVSLYGMDLCVANMARVHVPGALFATMLAGAGAAWLFERAGARAGLVGAVLAVLLGASAWPTVVRLWAPTNEQAEDEFLRDAIARLPEDKPFTLVRQGLVDRDVTNPNSSQTHAHFPDYLVRPPSRQGVVLSVRDWVQEPDASRPAYFVAGMRCYAMLRPDGVPPPKGDDLQPACQLMRERFDLRPVLERDVPNRGDVWLPYYGDAPTLRLGLYEIARKGG